MQSTSIVKARFQPCISFNYKSQPLLMLQCWMLLAGEKTNKQNPRISISPHDDAETDHQDHLESYFY